MTTTDKLTRTIEVKSTLDPALAGSLTLAIPTAGEQLKIAVQQARLRDGLPPEQLDKQSLATAIMCSTLSVVVREAPDWWYRLDQDSGTKVPAPERLKDVDLLWEVFASYLDFKNAVMPSRRSDQDVADPAKEAAGHVR